MNDAPTPANASPIDEDVTVNKAAASDADAPQANREPSREDSMQRNVSLNKAEVIGCWPLTRYLLDQPEY